jgi:hypothetical protein
MRQCWPGSLFLEGSSSPRGTVCELHCIVIDYSQYKLLKGADGIKESMAQVQLFKKAMRDGC